MITKTGNISYIEVELNGIGLSYGSRDSEGAVIGINDVEGIISSRDIDKVLGNGPGSPGVGVWSKPTTDSNINGSIGTAKTGRRCKGIGSYNGRRIYECKGSSSGATIGIGNGYKIGSLYEVGKIFGCLP